jgi:uracil-DNA glycosylase family 4
MWGEGHTHLHCNPLTVIESDVVQCRRCPRLIEYIGEVARVKRRAYRDQEYWGRPVPAFGDENARVLILGLAPAAHGANRTGRMFTGDRSGDWLYRVLHRTGFATQPESVSRADRLRLTGAFITASARCAPPDNKPLPEEIRNCRPYLEREIGALPDIRVVVALGKIAFDNYLGLLKERGEIASRAPYRFGHGCEYAMGESRPVLLASYHPSQQNTSTRKLTEPMLTAVFHRAAVLAGLH